MLKVFKKHKILLTLLLVASTLLIIQIVKNEDDNYVSQVQYSNFVAGLLSDNNGGSNFIIYNTKTWKPTILLNLPYVSPDNYGAISSDGNNIAYTKWDKNNTRRYLEVYSVTDGITKSFYQDMPAKNEIVNISWLPDNETLLLTKNDKNVSSYQEIQILNVKTNRKNTLVKGEVWLIRTAEDKGKTAANFYLKGHESYLEVKQKKSIKSYDKNNPINPNIEWNYYLNQSDINEIYKYYGGIGTFDINNVINLMNVSFSPPRCSRDGTKIAYSATLDRNSAPGSETPLWMCAAIWVYDIKTRQKSIVYLPSDHAAIGRVDWIDNDEISFISYYDFQGSRDSVNYFNISTKKHRMLFPYSDENYNNVTLLPIGNRQITFTTSKKNDIYENSSTILFDVDSNKYSKLNIKFGNDTILLEKFIFTQLFSEKVL
jgi:hypothetical protein